MTPAPSRPPILAAVGWLAAAGGALAVAEVPYDAGESVCGVWGCYPPLPALAAMHLFWAVVAAAGVWAVGRWRPAALVPAGVVLMFVAGGAAAVVGRDLVDWLGDVPDEYHRFWLRRVAYTVATGTDLPVVQAMAAGVAAVVIGRQRVRPAPSQPRP